MICLKETERNNTPSGGRSVATLAVLLVPFPLGRHLQAFTWKKTKMCVSENNEYKSEPARLSPAPILKQQEKGTREKTLPRNNLDTSPSRSLSDQPPL